MNTSCNIPIVGNSKLSRQLRELETNTIVPSELKSKILSKYKRTVTNLKKYHSSLVPSVSLEDINEDCITLTKSEYCGHSLDLVISTTKDIKLKVKISK